MNTKNIRLLKTIQLYINKQFGRIVALLLLFLLELKKVKKTGSDLKEMNMTFQKLEPTIKTLNQTLQKMDSTLQKLDPNSKKLDLT